MLRRLHHQQPERFAFTPANEAWARAQITKYPEGRQASAIIPLLWRAQEQEGWLWRPAIEHVADMLDMAHIRALEVATFYFMFQLHPVGSLAHVQVCGTTSCMICGAEDLIGVCKEKIAGDPHELSADGRFSWEEVECLGACANAPMVQIGKDYYEDLTAERFAEILDELAAGKVPVPGPQNGRFAAEPKSGLTSLREFDSGRRQYNASAQLAVDHSDTIKRIDGGETPLRTPWVPEGPEEPEAPAESQDPADRAAGHPVDETGITRQESPAETVARPETAPAPEAEPVLVRPSRPLPGQVELASRRGSWRYEPRPPTAADPAAAGPAAGGDDLKRISGIGPGLEKKLHGAGVTRFAQIAAWTEADVDRMNELLSFKGRINREKWIEQARRLAEGLETDGPDRDKDRNGA